VFLAGSTVQIICPFSRIVPTFHHKNTAYPDDPTIRKIAQIGLQKPPAAVIAPISSFGQNSIIKYLKILRKVICSASLQICMSETQAVTDAEASKSAAELTAFQQNILAILSEEPMYGLAIKRELESYYGSEVNHGRLYPNLDDLVADGLLEKSELDKRTNQYELTEAGHDAVLGQVEWVLDRFVTDETRADEIRALLTE